jgi:hypothetical protein
MLFTVTESADESALGHQIELTEEHLLELIEAAYPNPVALADLAR